MSRKFEENTFCTAMNNSTIFLKPHKFKASSSLSLKCKFTSKILHLQDPLHIITFMGSFLTSQNESVKDRTWIYLLVLYGYRTRSTARHCAFPDTIINETVYHREKRLLPFFSGHQMKSVKLMKNVTINIYHLTKQSLKRKTADLMMHYTYKLCLNSNDFFIFPFLHNKMRRTNFSAYQAFQEKLWKHRMSHSCYLLLLTRLTRRQKRKIVLFIC